MANIGSIKQNLKFEIIMFSACWDIACARKVAKELRDTLYMLYPWINYLYSAAFAGQKIHFYVKNMNKLS